MKRSRFARLALITIVGSVGCGDGETIQTVWSELSTGFSAVRGYTRPSPNAQHAMVWQGSLNRIFRRSDPPAPFPVVIAGGNIGVGAAPWGYTRADNTEAILYVDPSAHHVHELTPLPGDNNWSDVDFTDFIGAPVASAFVENGALPDVIGYLRSDGRSAMYYKDATGHVIEIASNFGGQPAWMFADLSNAAGAQVTVKGSAFPYRRSDGLDSIVYAASDNHIHELVSNFAGSGLPWLDYDLTVASGDTSVPYSSPWAYKRSDGVNAVVYVDTNGSLRELTLASQGCSPSHPWCVASLPATSPNKTFRPSGYARGDAFNTVVYVSSPVGQPASIRELALVNGWWSDAPLPFPSNYVPVSEPFGHKPPAATGSVLVQAKNTVTFETHGVQVQLKNGSWSASFL